MTPYSSAMRSYDEREIESIFRAFVRNANAVGQYSRTIPRVKSAERPQAPPPGRPQTRPHGPPRSMEPVRVWERRSDLGLAPQITPVMPSPMLAEMVIRERQPERLGLAPAVTPVMPSPVLAQMVGAVREVDVAIDVDREPSDEELDCTPEPREPTTAGRILLLTKRKVTPAPIASQVSDPDESYDDSEGRVVDLTSSDEFMERLEANAAVPDVASYRPPDPPVPERSEDGQIPAGELDRILEEMTVLRRYGHLDQVRRRLEELYRRYPEDLLLLRRVAEFHLEADDQRGAMEALFTLAGRLFERRNVLGMRKALEQVLILDPKNRRAYKLLGLLDERPSTGTG